MPEPKPTREDIVARINAAREELESVAEEYTSPIDGAVPGPVRKIYEALGRMHGRMLTIFDMHFTLKRPPMQEYFTHEEVAEGLGYTDFLGNMPGNTFDVLLASEDIEPYAGEGREKRYRGEDIRRLAQKHHLDWQGSTRPDFRYTGTQPDRAGPEGQIPQTWGPRRPERKNYFYFDEAAAELGVTEEQLNHMMVEGSIRVFRSDDYKILKKEDVYAMKNEIESRDTPGTEAQGLETQKSERPKRKGGIYFEEALERLAGVKEADLKQMVSEGSIRAYREVDRMVFDEADVNALRDEIGGKSTPDTEGSD